MKKREWCMRASGLAMLMALAGMTGTGSPCAGEKQSKRSGSPMPLEAIRQRETLVVKQLKDPALWKAAAQESRLLANIEFLKAIRSVKAIPLLVGRIDYSPYDPPEGIDRRIPPEQRYPVFFALVEIGAPVVPELIDTVKKLPPPDYTELNIPFEGGHKKIGILHNPFVGEKRRTVLRCLIAIYNRGGFGKAISKKRLELELAATKDKKDKASLRAALDHPIFKEEAEAKEKPKKDK